jgi:hypothetical protein
MSISIVNVVFERFGKSDMNKQVIILGGGLLLASLAFSSSAGGLSSLPSTVTSLGQNGAAFAGSANAAAGSATMGASPAAMSLPSAPATVSLAAAAASNDVLPGLDGMAEPKQALVKTNAIRPIRVPGGGGNINIPIPLPTPGLGGSGS